MLTPPAGVPAAMCLPHLCWRLRGLPRGSGRAAQAAKLSAHAVGKGPRWSRRGPIRNMASDASATAMPILSGAANAVHDLAALSELAVFKLNCNRSSESHPPMESES